MNGVHGAALLERVGRIEQVASVIPARIAAAGGETDVLFVRAGRLDATIVVSRALDISACSYAGIPLVWHGPGGLAPPHPGTLSDDAFARRFFGGLVTTCGLDAFGPAGGDAYGTWGQHGHVNHVAARNVRVDVDAASETITVSGEVLQARMFGERLLLRRAYTVPFDGSRIELHDRVSNLGGTRYPHMLLYHCNAGYPLLDEGLHLTLPHRAMRPRDDNARRGIDLWNRGGPPQERFHEQVFIHDPFADGDGWCEAEFANHSNGARLCVAFRPDELPACFSWRMLGIGTYVMAVEPANCATIEGRIVAEQRGTLPYLQPSATRDYHLRFTFASR